MGEDHRGRLHVQGATEGTGFLQGVRVYDVGGIPGKSPDDLEWEGGRDTTDLENPFRGGQDTEISNGIPGQSRPVELPGGGMHGPSGNKDRDAGAFPATACPRHNGHSGGGKPLPPTLHPMQHAVPLARPERQSPCHIPVLQGGRSGRGGGSRMHR